MMLDLDQDLDLRLDRVIRAPRLRVWQAWTDPLDLARWWLPAPTRCRVERLDVVPGGAFVTSMSDDGVTFGPHVDASSRAHHEQLGFADGWATVTAQLAAISEAGESRDRS